MITIKPEKPIEPKLIKTAVKGFFKKHLFEEPEKVAPLLQIELNRLFAFKCESIYSKSSDAFGIFFEEESGKKHSFRIEVRSNPKSF